VLIAATQGWHDHHDRARNELRRRLNDGDDLLLAAHALVECYSVLTRLPHSVRLTPEAAFRLIRASFVEKGTVVALAPGQYMEVLWDAARSAIAGGRIYDAVIAATARAANADAILTFNVRDFAGLAAGIAVLEPA
jgi:predicted nucleic acid-binding protein